MTAAWHAGANLMLMYIDGIEGVLPPQPEKAKELDRIYAAKGYPNYQYFTLAICSMKINTRKPFPCSARQRRPVNRALTFLWAIITKTVLPHRTTMRKPQSITKKAIDSNIPVKAGCYNRLGAMYFDGRGVEQDYDKAFRLLKWADDSGKTGTGARITWVTGYTYGEGTERDYVLARKYLEAVDWECQDAFFLLGWLYCNGEGGPEDIAKGVSYLQKGQGPSGSAGGIKPLQKRTFFGKMGAPRQKPKTVLRGLLRLQSMFGSDKK